MIELTYEWENDDGWQSKPIWINEKFIGIVVGLSEREGSQVRMVEGGHWNVKETPRRIMTLIEQTTLEYRRNERIRAMGVQ